MLIEYVCMMDYEHRVMLQLKSVMPHYMLCPWYCTGSMYPEPHSVPLRQRMLDAIR